jgi:hypothetical protein
MDPLVESALISAAATVVGVGGTVAVAYMGFRFSRRTLDPTRDGQIADRYTKAIDRLGSKEDEIRIGGIYALERIANDSARDHLTVIEVLTAFVRKHSRIALRQSRSDGAEPEQSPRTDVQAALTAIGRRDSKQDARPIDLSGAELTDAKLPHDAQLVEAKLVGVNLTRANLTGAILAGADLMGAILTRTTLTGADLTGTRWPGDAPVPKGWKLDTGSGLLMKAYMDSVPAEAN